MTFLRRLVIAVALVACGDAARAQDVAPVAVVRIELSPFDDQPASLEQIRLVISALPPRRVDLPTGGTISGIVFEQYGFGPSNLPGTFQLILERILELNELSIAAEVRQGPLLIPNLPTWVQPNRAPANAFPATARLVMVPGAPGVRLATALPESLVSERILDTTRRGASGVSLHVPLPIQLLQEERVRALLDAPFVSVPSAPLRLRFEQDTCKNEAPEPSISSQQAEDLRMLLANASRQVPLFIIDTHWPTAERFNESRKFLKSLADGIRKRYGLPLTTLNDEPFVAPGAVFPHASRIETALQQFRALDPMARVQTVYVPLSKEQGSVALLREILEVSDVVRRVTSRFGPDHVPSVFPPDILSAAKKHAQDVVQGLAPSITGAVTETDKSIVEAVVTLAADTIGRAGGFYVVNESWTALSDVVRYEQPANLFGTIVAATGNDGRNVHLEKIDFAQRSGGVDVVAVMNVATNGEPTCNSAVVEASVLDGISAVGFNGAIPGRSGTSYAAPRVAWLIAAAEAVRTRDVDPTLRAINLKRRLKDLRNPGGGLPVLRVDPVRLVRLWELP